jgi:predicted Zn-dependent protease
MQTYKLQRGEWRYLSLLVVAIWLIIQFQGCAEISITHRRVLHLVPEAELLNMGLQQYGDISKKSKLSTETQKVEMLRRVGDRIAKITEEFLTEAGQRSKISNYNWEFNLIEGDQNINARVMPGGRAAGYTGILPYTQNETGLAVVLGHEVAHALADYGNERMSQALVANMGGMALSAALSSKPQQTQQLFMTVFGVGANVGFLLPYSRLHESEQIASV